MGRVKAIWLEKSVAPNVPVRIDLPTSKSIGNRALIIQKLAAEGSISIEGISEAEDTVFLSKALEQDTSEIWLGDAGTAARFGLAYAAIAPGTRLLKGSPRLSQRPMKPLIEALRSLGAQITCLEKEGFLPTEVVGKELIGGEVDIDAQVSSQFISALMMVAPKMRKGLVIRFHGEPTSLPYLWITESVMKRFGAKVTLRKDLIGIGAGGYVGGEITIEPDWSAASYFFSAVALNPDLQITLKNLRPNSVQGDSNLIELYRPLGVGSSFRESGLLLKNSGGLKPNPEIDLRGNPDLAQTIAVTYAGLGLGVKLKGLHTLKVKETDRLEAVVNELAALGVVAEAGSEWLEIKAGEGLIADRRIKTYGDHRMAMAFAPLAFKTRLAVENPVVVGKSFPGFFEEFEKLGVKTYTSPEI